MREHGRVVVGCAARQGGIPAYVTAQSELRGWNNCKELQMKTILAITLALASPLALAAINLSLASLVELVIYLLIVGGVLWLLLWLVDYIGVPEPFSKVAKIVVMIVGVLILINVLLGFAGTPVFTMR